MKIHIANADCSCSFCRSLRPQFQAYAARDVARDVRQEQKPLKEQPRPQDIPRFVEFIKSEIRSKSQLVTPELAFAAAR